jgi:hypothetical protein
MHKSVVLPLALLVVLVSGALACGALPTPGPTPTPAPTPTPLPVQAPGWGEVTVHALCLEVEQSYPEIEGKNLEPIAEAAQRILAKVGLQVMTGGSPCDATLTLTLTGQALGEEYIAGYCYSGAEVNGVMLLDASGREPLTLPIAGKRNPPFFIRGCPTELEAPFAQAWSEALLQGLAHLWGPQVLIQALEDEAAAMRKAAAEALGEVGPEEEGVVPALAQALGDEDEDVRWAAAEALEAIGPQAAEAVPALMQALEDEDNSVTVRRAAAQALGAIGPQAVEAVPALARALGDESSTLSEDAAEALGRIGPGAVEAIPALILALENEVEFVRTAAAEALKAITGQDFGEDAAAWQQWWAEHQSDTPAAPPSECAPDAVFAADVTVPDSTRIEGGQAFVKTWRVHNTGTCDWDADFRLVFVAGEQMGGPDSVAVPDTPAGESAEISVELVAPQGQGKHRGYWRVCVGTTECFGDKLYVEIVSTE